MTRNKPHLSSLGDGRANLIAVACYLFVIGLWTMGSVLVLVVFAAEKRSGLVRFHALQALFLWVVRIFLGGGLSYEGVAALVTENTFYLQNSFSNTADVAMFLLEIAIDVAVLALGIVAAVQAYHWKPWRIPVLGLLAMALWRASVPAAYTGGEAVPEDCMNAKTADIPVLQQMQKAPSAAVDAVFVPGNLTVTVADGQQPDTSLALTGQLCLDDVIKAQNHVIHEDKVVLDTEATTKESLRCRIRQLLYPKDETLGDSQSRSQLQPGTWFEEIEPEKQNGLPSAVMAKWLPKLHQAPPEAKIVYEQELRDCTEHDEAAEAAACFGRQPVWQWAMQLARAGSPAQSKDTQDANRCVPPGMRDAKPPAGSDW